MDHLVDFTTGRDREKENFADFSFDLLDARSHPRFGSAEIFLVRFSNRDRIERDAVPLLPDHAGVNNRY